MSDISRPDRSAIVVARDADAQPDPTEIRNLAEAAGYAVVDTLTQRGPTGPYCVRRGKAESLARSVAERGADVVVFDDALTPGQYRNLVGLLPDETGIYDRHRVVLDIFAEQAGDKAARLQVELARLEYEHPLVKATEERTHMQEAAETGSRLVDIERRMSVVRNKLAEVKRTAADRRAKRREEGFDLVAIAGYTNAGKSTLLHRLADDLSVDSLGAEHEDVDGVAEVEDRLFKTLETTTRRGTIAGRRVLLTDTVGLVDGIPHELVESFSTTLDAVSDADVGLLVVDASDSLSRIREKVAVSLDELDEPEGDVVAVLNKTDLLDDDELAERRAVLSEFDVVDDVVAVSALDGDGVDSLREAVVARLPARREEFVLPNDGSTQSFLSWAHEHGDVASVDYESDAVRATFEARPGVVERARERAPDRSSSER